MQMHFTMPAPLSPEECDRIIFAARRLVADMPFRCDGTEEFNAALSDFGCDVGGGKIRFPKAVVDRLFDRIESEGRGDAYKPERMAELPDLVWRESDDVACGVSGQAGLICDLDNRLRACTSEDLARFSRLVDNWEDVQWNHPCMIPQDAPPRTRELHAYAVIALNNRRPRLVSTYSKEIVKHFLAVSDVCYGSREETKRSAPFCMSAWINSPFTLGADTLEGAMEVRRALGRPMKMVTMPVAGASAPVTLAGALVQGAAEVMMANIITLALDGVLNGYFCGPTVIEVRRGASMTGPESALHVLGTIAVARRLFRNDRYVFQPFSLTANAKRPGAQSMMEKSLSALMGVSTGGRVMGALSTLAYSDVISPVQFLLDLDIVGYMTRLVRGVKVNDKTLAEDTIRRVAPGGANFLADDHTFEHYAAEQWLPMFLDRQSALAAIADPKDMLDHAQSKAAELWESAPNQCPLDASQRKEIESILDAADKELC